MRNATVALETVAAEAPAPPRRPRASAAATWVFNVDALVYRVMDVLSSLAELGSFAFVAC
jgi:hypothetical protein